MYRRERRTPSGGGRRGIASATGGPWPTHLPPPHCEPPLAMGGTGRATQVAWSGADVAAGGPGSRLSVFICVHPWRALWRSSAAPRPAACGRTRTTTEVRAVRVVGCGGFGACGCRGPRRPAYIPRPDFARRWLEALSVTLRSKRANPRPTTYNPQPVTRNRGTAPAASPPTAARATASRPHQPWP